MTARRGLFAIAALAMALHGLGMARSILPAQDGLKFLRVAKRFHHDPWPEVVRGSDQHPLYAALVALAEPPVALAIGEGPTAWRVAAQGVSAFAALLTIVPLFGFARALFGEGPALVATLVCVLLPAVGEVGRDTLGDSTALLCFAWSLRLGELALRTGRRSAWLGTGAVAGVGYLARPEVLLVPVAVAATAVLPALGRMLRITARKTAGRGGGTPALNPAICDPPAAWPDLRRLASMGVVALFLVGGYALVKGEVSEKVALRLNVGMAPSARPKPTRAAMPEGLDPRWDFAPKEESVGLAVAIKGSARKAATRLAQQWADGMGWIMLPFIAWGLIRARAIEGSTVGRRLVGVYLILFGAVVVRHATGLGYLSGRHALTIVLATLPWAGAGIWDWARGMPARRGLSPAAARRLAVVGLSALIGLGVSAQVRGMHPTRWGHREAGRWLLAHADPADAVLDTRGWATFVRGGPGSGYDPWHIRQALTDARLAYVVIGADELAAETRRGATYRALLAYAGTPVAAFPDREGDAEPGVFVYRFQVPESWRGMTP